MATQQPIFRIQVQGTKDVIRLQEELKKVKAEAKKTTDESVFDQLAAQIVKLEAELKNARREQRQAVNEFLGADKGVGAYKRLSAQLNASKKALKDMAAEGKSNSVEFKKLLQDTRRLDAQLKNIDASVGEFGRNVGNYAGSLKGLFGQLRSTVRQSRLLQSIPNLFYMAVDAVNTLNNAVDLYNETFDASYVTAKRVEEATSGLVSEYIKEEAQLKGLVDTAKGENATKEQRKLAVDALQSQYPEYFSNLDRENISIENLEAGYKRVNEEIIKNLKAKIRAQIIEKQLQDAVEKTLEAQKAAQAEQAQALLQANDVQGLIIKSIANIQTQQAQASAQTAKTAASNIEQVDASLEAVFATLKDVVDDASLAFDNSEKNLKELAKTTTNEQKKLNKEVEKEAERAEKKRQDLIKKINDEQIKLEQQNASRLLDLQKQLQQAIINNIADEGERTKAQEAFNFQQSKNQRQSQFEELKKQLKEQEDRLVEVYKEGSKQVIDFRAETAAKLAEIQAQFDAITQQEAILHQSKLSEIEKQGQEDRLQEAIEAQASKLEALETQYQIDVAILETSLAEQKKSEEESYQARIEAEKAFLMEKRMLIQQQIDNEVFADDAAKQKLILQREQLNAQLAQLENQQTSKVEEEADKQKQARQKAVEDIFNNVSKGISAISDLLNATNDAELKRFDAQIENRQKNIEDLEEQLENASGLQKAFLESQVEEEVRQQEVLLQQKEELEKKAAKRNKAVSIIQAIINTALGVSQALATLPPPASFVTAAITGALGAVQVATIAAQPLATGGIVGKHITGQKINRSNGDNVLTTLKTGEVVLNKAQQARIGGAPALKKAGVRGFASGGVVSAPNIQKSIANENNDLNGLINAINQKTDAINGRIDRLEVIFTASTQAEIDEDKKQVQAIKSANKL